MCIKYFIKAAWYTLLTLTAVLGIEVIITVVILNKLNGGS
jgi:hypothetical protein